MNMGRIEGLTKIWLQHFPHEVSNTMSVDSTHALVSAIV
jgi:hypothetical protein